MVSIINMFKEYLVMLFKPKVKQPLSQENAYACYASGPTLDKVYERFCSEVFDTIKYHAGEGILHTLVTYPKWFTLKYRALFEDYIESLNYTILYKDEDVVLLSIKMK